MMLLVRTAHKISLQRPQESEHIRLFTPAFSGLAYRWFAMREGLGLHLQIDFGIDIGRVERDMSQPSADRVDVHSRSEEVDGRGVTDRVCAHFLPGERGYLASGLTGVSLDQRQDSKTGEGLPASVQKDRRGAV